MNESHDKRRDQDSWHLKKEINVSHIFTTLSVIVAILLWGSTVETRLALNARDASAYIKHMDNIDRNLGKLVDDVGYLRGQAAAQRKQETP